MSTVPSQYNTATANKNSLRKHTKHQRNPWKAASSTQEVSGYSGNSDTLSSGSRKYRNSTRKITSSTSGPHQREIICHQPEPSYENVPNPTGGGPGSARMTLVTASRYNSNVPLHHSVRQLHQGTSSSLYTLQHSPHTAHAPLIDASRPSTSPEAQNIYDVIEEKSSGRRTGTSRGTTMPHRPMTPGSVRTVASETGVYACGGHCLTFETVCDKILRVVYGIGVLIGVGLLLAGMNGHQLRMHQNTLVYIGLMVFSVCCFLLWIQCHHYSNRRRRRTVVIRRPAVLMNQECIRLQDFNINSNGNMNGHLYNGTDHVAVACGANHNVLMHENPLLHRYIEQQSTYSPLSLASMPIAPSFINQQATNI